MEKKFYELTAPQKSIWLTEQYYKNTNINNICGTLFFKEKIDLDILERALKIFIQKNQALSIKISNKGTYPEQYICDKLSDYKIERKEIKSIEELKRLEEDEADKPIEIIESVLFRFVMFQLPDGTGGVIPILHHIISDAWSYSLIANGIKEIYESLIFKTDMPENKPLYTDYIKAEKEYELSNRFLKDKEYWENAFSEIPDLATIKLYKNNETKTQAIRKKIKLSKKETERINNFAKVNRVSTYSLFMALYSIYLSKVSSNDDVIIGTPFLNRTNSKEKNTIGMFINTLPNRIKIKWDINFSEFVKEVSKIQMSILRHQRYPYNKLLEKVRKEKGITRNLYDIVISYQNARDDSNESKIKYCTRWTFNKNIADSMEIHIYDMDNSGELQIYYDYQENKFTEEEIKGIHLRIMHILDQVIARDCKLSKIEAITKKEKDKILLGINKGRGNEPKSINEIFEEQVNKTPNSIALVFEEQKLTYKQLNEKANCFANYLISKGISNNDIVGLCLNRSIEVVVAMIGTLKAGAAYLPIDPEYPKDRIEYMANNSNCKLIFVEKNIAEKFEFNGRKEDINNQEIYNYSKENLNKKDNEDNLAYLIYTSGSTGVPKGAMLKRIGLKNLIFAMNKVVKYNEVKSIVAVGTISFDITILEIIIPLMFGMKVIVANNNQKMLPTELDKLIKKHSIEMIAIVPSRMEMLLNENCKEINSLKKILLGGEAFSGKLYEKIKSVSEAEIYNAYGPTEITVASNVAKVKSKNCVSVIGKPLLNVVEFIFDKNMQLQPIGIPGELYIGGPGLFKGYINNKKLTEEKTVNWNGYKLYKTGDIALFDNDGNVDYLGRNDNQIKLRGLRIELGEIENKVMEFPNIASCIVSKIENEGREFLCAYIVGNNINIKELRKFLNASSLPYYMIPQYFVVLKQFTYLPNGKVDRKSLPFPELKTNIKIIKPRDNLDDILINIFQKIFGIGEISIEDSFFDIGGDSLMAIRLSCEIQEKLNAQVSVQDIFSLPTIKELADFIKTKNNVELDKIQKIDKKKQYISSTAEQRIYLASKLDELSLAYNMPGKVIFKGNLDINKLETALNTIIHEQEILRTCFNISEDGKIMQQIVSKYTINLDIQKCDENEIQKYEKEFVKPFDLSKLPLFRVKLLQISKEKSILLFDMHHIISDGSSMQIFVNRLVEIYNNNDIKETEITYKDYCYWENNRLENDKLQKQEEYWLSNFTNNEIPILSLPTDFTRPIVKSFNGNRINAELNEEKYRKIQKICEKYNITPFMFFLSVYYILLSRYSGQEDIIIGVPIANRNQTEFQELLGAFINEMPIRIIADSSMTFRQYIEKVKSISIESMKNGEYPFNKIVEKININKDASRNPLYDVMFVYQNTGEIELKFKDIEATLEYLNDGYSKFDLTLEIVPKERSYILNFEYCTDLFKTSTIDTMKSHFINIIEDIISNPNITIGDIEILSETEKKKILYDFNNNKCNYPKNKTIHKQFEEQVQKNPNSIAVIANGVELTYKELNEKANQLANYIKEKYNIKENDVVVLMTQRTIELIIGQIAILKTGAAYLPIDPNYPNDRIEYILKNSSSKLILTNLENNKNAYTECDTLNIKITNDQVYNNKYNRELSLGNPHNGCYVIYTSGSTGKPKGVVVSHLNVSNFIKGLEKSINLNKKNVVSVTTMSFDIFVVESLATLLYGSKIILANEEEQNIPELLNKLCIENCANVIQTTPSRYGLLLSDEKNSEYLSKMSDIISGGEPITEQLLSRLKKISNAKIYNIYGPTETTVWSTLKELTHEDKITIGKPIINTNIYILNKNKKLLPIGAIGEIYIGGAGVSLGYLNNIELTNEKFTINPYNKEETIYATGDLGKWLPDGEIMCLGRNDNQIKVSGNRVELSEIEKAIQRIESIKNAVVIARADKSGRKYLCAYVVSNERIRYSKVREQLCKTLPIYMIPTQLVQLENLPYTPNGKIDKMALPKPANENADKIEYNPPTTKIQRKLVRIFEDILPTRPIGINDNFFEIGGDSLLAMQLQIRLLNLGKKITYAEIFSNPTIQEMEKIIINSDIYTNITRKNNIQIENNNFKEILDNNLEMPKEIRKKEIGNVLITGTTGFLGSHILENYINNSNGKIYCLIRREAGITPKDKLIKTLEFYFDNKYVELINKRIFIVEADFSKERFGLLEEEYEKLANNVNWVINSAAKVTHFGNYKEFEDINVKGTRNIVEFCSKFNKKLLHISTMSVSGNSIADTYSLSTDKNKEYVYTEGDFYIKQSLENEYVRTKFEAEAIVLDSIKNGTDAYIARMGNLTSRYYDGKFQRNINDNAFMNRLKSFIEIGNVPVSLANEYLELTPIDKAAQVIVLLTMYANKKNRIFHVYNNKFIEVKRFINAIEKNYNKIINILSDEEFSKKLKELLKEKNELILQGIAADLNENETVNYGSNIKLNCDFTTHFLKKVGFEWNEIDEEYLKNMFMYLRKIKFIE